MNNLKQLMLNYPTLSIILILPFSLMFVFALFGLIINVLLPFIFALWIANWVYGVIVGSSMVKPMYEPFWVVRSKKL
ncbi:hypothetical protein OAQ12_01910 [Candidatus Marinimicrobia bacterium]|jgi:hypothetical protein|nr:hypothetical protein [Candidatus Neomarinimicrobiota bacterium]MDG1223412.1 hypothetical protein [Candidatus Neomarinimicrobiota bacterium]|tara:strand:- start:517 stop:747 length:231 start_codon:yes stop_codon:yes gene_type:complete